MNNNFKMAIAFVLLVIALSYLLLREDKLIPLLILSLISYFLGRFHGEKIAEGNFKARIQKPG